MNVELTLSDADLDAIAERVAAKLAGELSIAAAGNGNSQGGRLLWNEREAAERLGVAAPTLKNWRLEGSIEAHSSRPVRYTQENIDNVMEWMRTREDSK